MNDRVPVGSRPVHKILDGAEAPNWLHFAMNKLEQMRLTQSGPTQQHIIIGDVDIRIEKSTTWDRITIRAGGVNWIAIGSNYFPGAANRSRFVLTQLAKAGKANGPWTEKPTNPIAQVPVNSPDFPGGITDGTVPFDASLFELPVSARSLSLERLQSLGDGRTVFQVAGQFEAVMNPYLLNKDGTLKRQLFFPSSITNRYGQSYGSNAFAGYDAIFSWSMGLVDRNQAMINSFCFAPEQRTFNGVTRLINTFRFSRVTVDYIPAAGDLPIVPPEVYRQVVISDVTMTVGHADNPRFGFPEWIMVTPERIIASSLYDDLWPYASTTRYDATSVDGGKTFQLHAYGNLNQGPLHVSGFRNVSYTSFAALNGSAALRLSPQVDVPASAGTPDTIKLVVERVGIDGTVTPLYRIPDDVDGSISALQPGKACPFNTNLPTYIFDHFNSVCKIYALGRNAFVIRLVYYYLLDAGSDTGFPYYTPLTPIIITARVKTIRSFDGGVTWDDPLDDGFDVFPKALPSSPSTPDRNGQHDADRKLSTPMLYVHKPYTGTDPGEVYQIIDTISARSASVYIDEFFSIAQTLYVSRDQCRTWQPVTEIAHISRALPPFPANAKQVYANLIDKNAAIDPVFPWRLDGRVAPPDWW